VPTYPIAVKRRPIPRNVVEVLFQWQTNPLPTPIFPSQLSPFLSASEFQSLVIDGLVVPVQRKQNRRNWLCRSIFFIFFLFMVAGAAVLGVGSQKANDDLWAAEDQAIESNSWSSWPDYSDYTIETRYPGLLGAGVACLVIGFIGIVATCCFGCRAPSAAQADFEAAISALQQGGGGQLAAERGLAFSVYEEDAVLLVQVGNDALACTETAMKICTLHIQCPGPAREPMTYLTHGSLKSEDGSSTPMPFVTSVMGARIGIPISCMPDASSQFVLVSPADLLSPIDKSVPTQQLQQMLVLQQQQLQLQQQQLAALGLASQASSSLQPPRPEGPFVASTATVPYPEGMYHATATAPYPEGMYHATAMAPYPPLEVAKNGGAAPLFNPYSSTATAGEGLGGGAPPPPLPAPIPYPGSIGL
jgi:hypothetical protein